MQGFRPDFLKIQASGAHVLRAADGSGYDLALVLAGRHRGENEARLADAARRAGPGGLIVMAGSKTDGISSLRKRLAGHVSIAGHLSKNHGEVFWLDASREAVGCLADLGAAQRGRLVEGRFHTAPGMFSHDRVDPASRLLAARLPADMRGRIADFCAGWGFLSVAVAERAPHVESIDLYEADFASLEAARRNMAELAGSVPAGFFWCDLAAEAVERRYDAIVMNPPFHRDRAADPGLGVAMIEAAGRALRPGGALFMVANRQLPYEQALSQCFARVEKLVEEGGFKVFRARR